MAIAANSLVYRSPRRIRVVFTNTLAGGAFSASWFAVVATDATGTSPSVVAALVISDSPTAVELALGDDLAAGGNYKVVVSAGVPALDASTAPGAELAFRAPGIQEDAFAAGVVSQALASFYGEDLAFVDGDWLEGPDGDLAGVDGVENVKDARQRDALSEGLAWRADYGAHLRQFVDSPLENIPQIRAALLARLSADDRVKSATVRYAAAMSTAEQHVFAVELNLVGDISASLNVTVPSAG